MLFNSLEFLIFFPIVLLLYHVAGQRVRCGLLLAASWYFYSRAGAAYLWLLGGITLFTYLMGLALEHAPDVRRKKWLVTVGIILSFVPLLIFKYTGMLDESLAMVLSWSEGGYDSLSLRFIVPVGLSFYTFQAVGYLVDVFAGRIRAERNPIIYALYVSFFPQLVAGPIERPNRLLPQFHVRHSFRFDQAISGLQLMLWGFMKKLVIADKLALTVNMVYSDPAAHSSWGLLVATWFFGFQIYCDFSGYSDIAIGAARVMGFDLMENFNRPYLSSSPAEFWRRWHVSLYSWFRDYLYIPLGGSAKGQIWATINVFIVFFLSGVWHGANYTFVLWGVGHGLVLMICRLGLPAWRRSMKVSGLDRFPRVRSVVQAFLTLNVVMLLWVFFRAETVGDAFLILGRIITEPWVIHFKPVRGDFTLLLIGMLMLAEIVQRRQPSSRLFAETTRPWLQWVGCSALLWLLVFWGEFENQQFIYFVF